MCIFPERGLVNAEKSKSLCESAQILANMNTKNLYKHIVTCSAPLLMVMCLLAALSATGQKLSHVLGDFIVELPAEVPVTTIGKELAPLGRSIPADLRISTLASTGNTAIYLLHLDPNQYNENKVLSRLRNLPYVLNAQHNHITKRRAIPNDPRFTSQWQYINDGSNGGIANSDLDMDLAWDITTGGVTAAGDTIVVAVIDDGVNFNHPDLAGNLWVNRAEIPDNGIDDDNNGYIDDYRGWNARTSSAVNDNEGGGHGTPVTGIIAAVGNNSIGVSGVNWNTKAMIIDGEAPESVAIAAYGYALAQRLRYNETNGAEGAFVVATNSSWGLDRVQASEAPIWCDFYNILGEAGILSCGATANVNVNVDVEGDLPTSCPSEYLIAVTNLNREDNKAVAGFGSTHIDIGAYGSATYTLTRTGYGPFGGTSGATPHVTGVIALLYSIDCLDFIEQVKSKPALGALAIKDYILFGATPNEDLENITVTGGRLNALTAVANAMTSCSNDCNNIFGVTVARPDVFTANFEYINMPNQGQGLVRYREKDQSEWVMSQIDDGLEAENLIPCTEYQYQSATICGSDTTDYSYTKVFTTSGCCEAPLSMSTSLENDVATVTWPAVNAASEYSVDYRIDDGISAWQSVVFDNTVSSITIPDIIECQAYEVRMKATCSVSGRESDYVTATFIGNCGFCTSQYCVIPPKNTRDEYINVVSIEDVFTNVSGNDGGYGNYQGKFDINVQVGREYDLTLVPGYEADKYAEWWSVYVDYNQDGIMDETELIFTNTASTIDTTLGSFIIPEDAISGISRMRVIMRFGQSNDSSCDGVGWEFGEYEDYCITILDSNDCPPSIAIVSTIDSTDSSLSFDLTPGLAVENYTVSYKTLAAADYTSIVSSSPTINLTNLERCSDYEVIYSASCVDDQAVAGGEIILKTKCSTSIQTPLQGSLTLYPSPSYDFFSIQNEESEIVLSVSIYTTAGEMVYVGSVNSSSQMITVHDSQQLAPGLYFISIRTLAGTTLLKWVKL